MSPKKIIVLVSVVVAIFILLMLSPFVKIDAGERGVVLNWGAVSDTILDEGIHWRIPIKQKVIKMDVTIQKEETGTSAASKDLQIVTTNIAINYELDKLKVNTIYQNLRKEYSQRIVAPTIEELIKKTTAKFTAEELVTRREDVKEDLKLNITQSLASNYIIVKDIFITDFTFSAQFDLAIEAKVTAEQRALEAKNKLEQIKYEAEQRVAQAEAEAKAIMIQAQAVTQQGGKDYVQLQAILKWNGQLPEQMIPGATVPFINLSN
uniref:Putative SPFH domain / band 7 protein n=1 Tax=viral metagenome TaxID=1070528 RepID=A0A6M3JKC9_9ZZZZ